MSNYWDPYQNRMKYNDSLPFQIQSSVSQSKMQLGEKIWFILQNYGILITDGNYCLASADPEVTHGATSSVEWVPFPTEKSEDLS